MRWTQRSRPNGRGRHPWRWPRPWRGSGPDIRLGPPLAFASLAQWQSERLLSAGTVVRFHREARGALARMGFCPAAPSGACLRRWSSGRTPVSKTGSPSSNLGRRAIILLRTAVLRRVIFGGLLESSRQDALKKRCALRVRVQVPRSLPSSEPCRHRWCSGPHIVPVVASWCARTGMLPGPLSPGRAGRVDPQRRVSTTSHPLPKQEHITRSREEQ